MGHGANPAIADGVLVDGDDWSDLGGGAAHEHLIGKIARCGRPALDDLQAKDFPCARLDQRIAGDALQDATGSTSGVISFAVGDEHHTGAGPLGNFS